MTQNRPFSRGEASPQARAGALVELLGGHVSRRLALDLDDPDDTTLGRWLVASALLGGRQPEAVGVAACCELARSALLDPKALAAGDSRLIEQCLDKAGLRRPDQATGLLVRLSGALQTRHQGSIESLAAAADGLPELAGGICSLAPGYGPAAVTRFLTPLRHWWHAAADLPASPAVRAAAADLGFVAEGEDEEAVPGRLAQLLSSDEPGTPEGADLPGLRDLEAALDRLGRGACLRGAAARCPLGAQCPRRE
jgi:hypothetical protein